MKTKKLILLLSLFIVSLVLVGCGESDEEVTTYPGLHYIGNDELYELLNTETEDEDETSVFVYIGRPTCPMCQEFEPILEEALVYLGMELKYFQTDMARVENEDLMLTMMETLGITGVPTVAYIVNGELRDFLMGMYEVDEVVNFFRTNDPALLEEN
ncbi:MAG: thioredoxin family protein [Turicibacter sp.]|nr:thioredoxin family protein [Turicibacter sp.]